MNPSLLFIPDITGFTRFVNDTEVAHGQHVVSELLELIIDSNRLNMTVAEIEGDAVLFYRPSVPSAAEIMEQARSMFEAFHQHLKQYEHQRICECGACRSAPQLSLKIVAHAGAVELLKVKGFEKPYGSDVILAHRLLKNDVDESEYLLLTDAIPQEESPPSWACPEVGDTVYEDFGSVAYRYIPLGPLRSGIPDPPPPPSFDRMADPIVAEIVIDRPLEDVYELVSNFDLRLSWNQGVDELHYEKGRVNRVGTRHHCVVGGKLIEFETVTDDFGEGRRAYGEHILGAPLVDDAVCYWIMESEGSEMTTLRVEVHYKARPFPAGLLTPLFRFSFGRRLPHTLEAIRAVAEEQRSDRPGRTASTLAGTAGALALLLSPLSVFGQVAPPEGLEDWIDGRTPEVHSFLARVVNINSGSRNLAGVRSVGDLALERLQAIGFDAEWIDMSTVERAGHVRAYRAGRAGTEGRSVLLIGHLDTVFEEDDPFDTFVRDGSRATGPGIVDDKGGVVVLLTALEALHAVGGLDGAAITVLLTGDEETVGRPLEVARAPMVEAARNSDLVLSFERGFQIDGAPFATVARRGSSSWTLTVDAKQAHSGRIFTEADGVGAINEVSRIIYQFYDELAGERFLTFNVGSLVGGTEVEYDPALQSGSAFGRTNVIPNRAIARGDLRTISQEQLQRIRTRMQEIVDRSLPMTQATIAFRDGYPAMSPRDSNYDLLAEYSAASESVGLGPIEALDPGLRGAGDVAFASDHTGAALDGLGPQGGDTHGPGEWVDLDSFAPAIKRAAALIHRLTTTRGN